MNEVEEEDHSLYARHPAQAGGSMFVLCTLPPPPHPYHLHHYIPSLAPNAIEFPSSNAKQPNPLKKHE